MKNNISSLRELSFYHETEKVWYCLQPSSFSNASFMVTRLGPDDYGPNPMVIGSLNRCLKVIDYKRNKLRIKNYIST